MPEDLRLPDRTRFVRVFSGNVEVYTLDGTTPVLIIQRADLGEVLDWLRDANEDVVIDLRESDSRR